MNSHLENARATVETRKRELRALTVAALDETNKASEKRQIDAQIQAAEVQLAKSERALAIIEARILIPASTDDGQDTDPSARGSLRSEGVYRPDQKHSFFRDMVNAAQDPDAQQRLQANQREALASMGANELRDVTSAAAGAGGFIPPAYLGDLWANLPRPSRPFADIVPTQPIPDTGLTISVPQVQSGVTTTVQAAELDAVSETDIDTESVTANLVTIAGLNDISLQALERSYPGMDVVIFQDLLAAHDAELDRQLLADTGTNGQHLGIRNVTGHLTETYTAGTPSSAVLLPKIYESISKVASARFLGADTIVMHPSRAAWLASGLSASFPLFAQGGMTQTIGTQEGGFATSFGGLRVVLDANIGSLFGSGTNQDEIYVCRAADYMLFESQVQTARFDQVLSSTLAVRLRLHSYSFFVPQRWGSSTCVLSGTGLSSPVFG